MPAEPEFCVLVVAKAPVPGFAKTRLCPPATPEQAAWIAAAALLDTLDAVLRTPGARPVVAMTGDLDHAVGAPQLRAALAGMTVIEQHGDTFADRLANAHAEVAGLGLPVVQIGMDTPQVTPTLLTAVHTGLGSADAVLGPAEDGGWWVLGLRDPNQAGVLRAVPMSAPDTGARTLAALRATGLRTGHTAKLSDVDTVVDAVTVAQTLPGSRFATAVAQLHIGAGAGR